MDATDSKPTMNPFEVIEGSIFICPRTNCNAELALGSSKATGDTPPTMSIGIATGVVETTGSGSTVPMSPFAFANS